MVFMGRPSMARICEFLTIAIIMIFHLAAIAVDCPSGIGFRQPKFSFSTALKTRKLWA